MSYPSAFLTEMWIYIIITLFGVIQFWNHLSIWDFLKTPSVIYFRSPLSKCDSVRRLPSTLTSLEKSSNLYLWKLQLLYIFEILWAIVTQFQSLSRSLALPILKGSFILISLKTPSVIYFRNPLSNCDSVRRLPSFSYQVSVNTWLWTTTWVSSKTWDWNNTSITLV